MVYVKVDSNGDVLEFPYRIDIFNRLNEIPDDARIVDTRTQLQTVKWYEGLWYDRVERQGDSYVLYYKVGLKKFPSDYEKKKSLDNLITFLKSELLNYLNADKITKEQYDQKLSLINLVNIDDETTYDHIDSDILTWH